MLNQPEPQAMPIGAGCAAPGDSRGIGVRGWRPWHGRARVRDALCVAAIALGAGYQIVVIVLTPLLIASHPVLLETIAGSNASVVAGGAFAEVKHNLPLGLVIVAPLPAMMRTDWVMWWAGRLWGYRFAGMLGRHSSRAAAVVRLAERRGIGFAAPLVMVAGFLPGGFQVPIYLAAGWMGLPLARFLIADLIGTAGWAALLATLGYLLGSDGVAMAGLVARYALLAICLPALIAIAPHAWRAWRHTSKAAAPGVAQDPSP